MRRIELKYVAPGVDLAKTIYDNEGRILLNAGVSLTEMYITRLRDSGVVEIYINDEMSEGIFVEDVICEQTRVSATIYVSNMLLNYNLEDNSNYKKLCQIVEKIIDELFNEKDILMNLTYMKTIDDYTFEHSVNVCVLSLLMGISLGLSKQDLKDLGIGAILHDIGKMKINESILKKPAHLSAEEFEEIKKHTLYGHEIIKRISNVSPISACIILTHHERIDGSGYPLGLKSSEIHEYARIVAVADVFDALTSDRVYRKKLLPHEVMIYIRSTADKHFDGIVIDCLSKIVALYPKGMGVVLSTGEKCLVVNQNKMHPSRPIVRVIHDCIGNRLEVFYEIDLVDFSNIYISGVCELV